jgi:hypothetical protein
MQKPPHRVGKRFQDCFVVVPEKKKVKKPADLKTRPAWLRQGRLGVSPEVCLNSSTDLPSKLPGMASAAMQVLRCLTATTSSSEPTRMVKERGLRRRTA